MTRWQFQFRFSLLTLIGLVTLVALVFGLWQTAPLVVVLVCFLLTLVAIWLVLIEGVFWLNFGSGKNARKWILPTTLLLLAVIVLLYALG